MAVELLADLEGRTWSDEEDRWRWELKDFGIFTVKSAYSKLEHLFLMEDLCREEERMVFSNLWKSLAPTIYVGKYRIARQYEIPHSMYMF